MCRTPNDADLCQYTTNTFEVEQSAVSGCNWCQLVLSLNDNIEEPTLDKGQNRIKKISVAFGAGPREEYFTPRGNNRFSLWVSSASHYLTAFTTKDDVTSDVVTAREIEHQVNSPMAFELAKKWLKECSSHENCGIAEPAQLPSRVIEVSPKIDPGTPRLIESITIVDHYVALSYCWGQNQTGLTTKANIEARQKCLNMETLSRTIQDAILVTRKLDIKYLWVDAVCIIIQDSREDKNIELAKMGKIYQSAFVTIVAANAGLDGRLGTVSIRLEGWYDDSDEPINTRAWTLQERLLSSRLLIYASHTLQYQHHKDTNNLGDSINIPSGLAAWRIPPASENLNIQATCRIWKHIISMYSPRSLSFLEDKLTALAGVAELFQQQSSVDYLAGLWSGDMLPGLLLWQASRTDNYTPCSIYIAPSWSWAYLNSPVYFSTLYNHHFCKWYDVDILAQKIILESPKLPFGRVTGGYLKIVAHVRFGVYHPPQFIRWESSLIGSTSEKDIESEAVAYLDDDIFKERNVICLAIARRRNDLDADQDIPVTFGSAAKSLFEYPSGGDSDSWSVIDGLIIVSTGVDGIYRRAGCFFGTKESEFKNCSREEVTLI